MASLDIRAIAAVTVVTFIFILTASPNPNAAIACNEVTSDIAPCLSYARNGSGEPSEQCCSGVRRLNSTAATEADRQAACNCLQNLVRETNLNADAVASIPEKCGVNVPYPIKTSTNCSQVH